MSKPGQAPASAGLTTFAVPEQRMLQSVYATLTPNQRTWRCELMKRSAELLEQAMALLGPIAKGRWNEDKAYRGLALLAKGFYESQGHGILPMPLVQVLAPLMATVRDKMPWQDVGGRRCRVDTNPARYALRVVFNCLGMVAVANLGITSGQPTPQDEEFNRENNLTVARMAASCLDKLGGPRVCERCMPPQSAAELAQLADDMTAEEFEALVRRMPVHVVTMASLRDLYDTDLIIIKWLLHYVSARVAKAEYDRLMTAGDPSGASAQAPVWLEHCRCLVPLAPLPPGTDPSSLAGAGAASVAVPSPQAEFMVAEARVTGQGAMPETLAAMRAAARSAERHGDDLVGWLAHLNVAALLVSGAAGGESFVEDEVLMALDAAAEQRSSVKRWGGLFMLEPRCKALKEQVHTDLEEARKEAQLRRQGPDASASTSAGGSGRSLPEGRLPVCKASGPWSAMPLSPVPHTQCAGCGLMFHKTMVCARCRQVRYCCKEHQQKHWREGHKNECQAPTVAAAASDSQLDG